MNAELAQQVGIARNLHSCLVPRLGRRRRRRLGARDVLAVMRLVTEDAEALATVELRFLIEELLSRGRHADGRRVTPEDLTAAGLTVAEEVRAEQRIILSAGSSMARTRDLPSAHAPLRDGPAIPLFHGFDDSTLGEEDRDDNPIAERVAARFALASEVIPFRITGPRLSASDVRDVLRAHGIEVDNVRLEPGSWPGQADVVGLRGGLPVLYGAVAIDLRVDGEHATFHAEITIHQEDG